MIGRKRIPSRATWKQGLLSGVVLANAVPLAAWAQAADHQIPSPNAVTPTAAEQDQLGLDSDIIVTAQRRAESVQDVPLAVTAFSGETLRQLGMTNTTDIVSQVPSVRISQFSPTVTVINIRGVSQNDFADHLEGPVAVYSDEAYVGSSGAISGQLFDLERVEVLRGPQGILFGRNATGGLIHYVSKKPSDTFTGYAEITAMTFGYGRLEAAVGGPLTDRVSGRLSVAGVRHDGYLKNRIGRDAQDARNYAARAQLQFELPSAGNLLLKGYWSKNDNETAGASYSHRAAKPGPDGLGVFLADDDTYWGVCGGCDPAGYKETDGNPLQESFNYPGRFNRTIKGATATLNMNIGPLSLTSVTDYMGIKKRFTEDIDSSPNSFLNYGTYQKYRQFSQELRISREAGPINWVAGLYLLNMDGRQTIDGDLLQYNIITDVAYSLRSRSYAGFAHAEIRLTPKLSFITGGRYTWDRRKFDYRLIDNSGTDARFNGTANPGLANQSWGNVSAKASVKWQATSDALVFASVTRGHKAGNFVAPSLPPIIPENIPHDQEVLTSYEVGTKTRVFDRRGTLNTSFFYYDYDNYQAFTLRNLLTTIGNRNASVKGLEVELALELVDGLNVSFSGSLLDSEVKGVVLPSGRSVNRDLPLAPDYAVSGLIRYERAAFGGLLAAQADVSYTDNFAFTVLSAPVEQEGGYFLGNARVAFRPSKGPIEVAVFVKNFADTRYRAFALDLSSIGLAEERYAPPRWWGGSISYRW